MSRFLLGLQLTESYSQFATVATLLTPPFFGLQEGFGKQYLRCLSFISDLAQLQGPEAET
jgi:hypothetical protein